MKRAVIAAVALLPIAAWVGHRLLVYPAPQPEPELPPPVDVVLPTLLGGSLPASALPRPVLLDNLELPDKPEVLHNDAHTVLLRYPVDTDAGELAGRWSHALRRAGARQEGNQSRPGQTLLLFSDGEKPYLLAVGQTEQGPFVLYTQATLPAAKRILIGETVLSAPIRINGTLWCSRYLLRLIIRMFGRKTTTVGASRFPCRHIAMIRCRLSWSAHVPFTPFTFAGFLPRLSEG